MSLKKIGEAYGEWIALALVLAFFLTSIASIAYRNVYSSAWDQGSYLRLGLQIRHLLALTDGNRHPLYPLLLVPLARPEIGYFTAAKVVSVVIGSSGLLATYFTARKVIGPGWAIAVVLMMAMNTHYRISAGYVDVEVLFVPLALITWVWASRAVQGAAANPRRAGRDAFIAGLMAGLTYLAKGTGMLMAIAFGFTLSCIYGPAVIKRRAPWCFAAGFALLATPLWGYHAIQYGNPLFNVNTTHIMWLDNWPSRFTFSTQELPTFGTYVRTHSMSQAVGRLANGLYRAPRQWYHAGHPFWSPDQPGPWLIWACWGACVLLIIGVTYRALRRWRARRGWFLFSLTTMALFYLSFAWYTPVDDSPRFVLPMIPMVYIALFWFLREMSASFPCLRRWVPRGLVVASTIAAGVYVGWHGADLNQWAQMPAHDRRQNEGSVRFMDVLLDRAGAGDAVVLGPTLALADWLAFDRQILPIPYVRQDWRSFSTWMVERGARHAVLDYESWDLRRPLLAQYWDFKDGLVASELPAGWELVYPPSFPCNPCLFAFDGQSVVSLEPGHTTDVRYGDAFTLLGYDVVSPSSPAGQGGSVVLYWRATAPVEDDIHVFVHLLDDQGNLAGQHDSVMAGGRLPARTLMAGMIVRDPHPLPDLARDTYTLCVGMYRWETMERLPAVQQGQLVPDGYPQVGQVTVDATGITVHERE